MANKTFILSDESINTYGFRVLTGGIQLNEFRKNPIMLWNHNSSWRGTKDEQLPIGRWDNIRVEGDRLLADAVLDDGDDFAKEIARKVDRGIINMCSMGFAVIEQSEDKSVIMPGQRYATVTRCRLREVSLVDMGSNLNSVALYDDDGKLIELSDGGSKPFLKALNDTNFYTDMKIIALKLGLPEAATQDEILSAITKLQDGSRQTVELQQKLQKIEQAKKDGQKAEAVTLIEAALRDGRIDAKAKESWKTLFETDFDNTKKTLQSLSGRTPLRSQIEKPAGGGKYAGKSWDELDKSGKLAQLKADDPELYQELFDEKFKK